MKQKIILTLLTCAMLLSAVSCGGKTNVENDPAQTQDTTAAETETEQATETSVGRDFSAFTGADLGGFTLRLGDTKQYDIYTYSIREELNGDVLNDALYNAYRAAEEKLNMTVQPTLYDDPSSLKNMILSGVDECDIITCQDLTLGGMALQGMFLDVAKLDHIDLTAPWWPQNAVESYRINGKMVIFSNYMSYFGLSRARVWFINKQLCGDFGMTVPYDDVFAGTWTFDKLDAMMANTYMDVNGNGERDMEDTYGYATVGGFICMQPDLGLYTYAPDKGGKLSFVFDLERASTAIDKLYHMYYEAGGVYANTTAGRVDQSMFKDGRTLFYFDSLGMASSDLRESDVEYGILIMPKLDEDQPDYIVAYTDYSHAVPKTVGDMDSVSWCIEALTASGYTTVVPAFIDVSLKNKYAYDADSAKMIDLIGEKMYVEIAYTFQANMSMAFQNLLDPAKPSGDIASYYEKHLAADLTLMEQLNGLED